MDICNFSWYITFFCFITYCLRVNAWLTFVPHKPFCWLVITSQVEELSDKGYVLYYTRRSPSNAPSRQEEVVSPHHLAYCSCWGLTLFFPPLLLLLSSQQEQLVRWDHLLLPGENTGCIPPPAN